MPEITEDNEDIVLTHPSPFQPVITVARTKGFCSEYLAYWST